VTSNKEICKYLSEWYKHDGQLHGGNSIKIPNSVAMKSPDQLGKKACGLLYSL
jgi:hypothetical protein